MIPRTLRARVLTRGSTPVTVLVMDPVEYHVPAPEDIFRPPFTIPVIAQLGDDWMVYATVDPYDRFAVLDLRFFPQDATTPVRGQSVRVPSMENMDGTWSGRPLDAPDGGLPWRLIRRVRERDIQDAARQWFDRVSETVEEAGVSPSWYRRVRDAIERNDLRDNYEPPSTAQRLALLAAEYVDLLKTDDGHRPNKVLAERHGKSSGWVATNIYRARELDLLRPRRPGRGLPDGSLTERAERILQELEQDPQKETDL